MVAKRQSEVTHFFFTNFMKVVGKWDSVFTYVVRRLNVVLARKSIKGWGEGGRGRLVEL